MITFDEMPDDNAMLSKVAIDFPRLEDDTEPSCPVPLDDIVDYLRRESPDYEKVTEERLSFLRTATIEGVSYCIWALRESDGSDCFVTVSLAPSAAGLAAAWS